MKYQPEIDGLRAISVLAVLFYHLGAKWIPGGFTGVDIFFVISGFLITTIIRNDIDRQTFSFSEFYARRIRRIFPALIVMLLVTAGAGYFLLAPGDYAAQAKSAVAAAASVSNIYFFLNTGYFDNAADTLPLLHTWSLGVEEQFYVVLPIFLIAISRTKFRQFTGHILVAALIAAFLISAWQVKVDQKSAFYLMHYRAWELGLGAMLAYIPSWRERAPSWCVKSGPLVGLALVAFSLFSVHPADSFPGVGALPAVVGSALILAFSGRENFANKFLSMKPLVWVGKISYSLYLWHWPLIVYWRHYVSGNPMTVSEQIFIGCLSIFCGWASWRWVETTTRHTRKSKAATISIGLAGIFIAAVPSAIIAASNGFPQRIPQDYSALQSKDVMWQWDCPENLSIEGQYICSAGEKWTATTQKAIVIGDSHAQHMMPLLHEAGLRTNTALALLGTCPPIFESTLNGLRHTDSAFTNRCHESRTQLFDFLSKNPEVNTVVIAGLWPMLGYSVYKTQAELANVTRGFTGDHSARLLAFSQGSVYLQQGLSQLAAQLQTMGVRSIVVSDIPTFQRDPIPCVLTQVSALLRRPCNDGSERVTRSQMEDFQLPMAEILRNAGRSSSLFQVVVPTDHLCRDATCEAYVNGTYIYRDADHLRRNMAREVYVTLADQIGLTSALSSQWRPPATAKSDSFK